MFICWPKFDRRTENFNKNNENIMICLHLYYLKIISFISPEPKAQNLGEFRNLANK